MSNKPFNFSGDDALNYDNYLGPLLFEPASVEFIQYLGDRSISSVLELSAGTGRLTKHLRSSFSSPTRVVASDISPDMLGLAKETLQDPTIEFQVADAQQLPYEDNTFDLVVCQFGMMFLQDKKKGFQEAFRVLKSGGRFVFATWENAAEIPLVNAIINDTIIPFFEGQNPDLFRTPFSLYDQNLLKTFLREAGFINNSLSSITFAAGKCSPEDVVNAFLLKHPLGRAVAEKDPKALMPMAARLEKEIRDVFGDPVDTYLKAIVGVGIRK